MLWEIIERYVRYTIVLTQWLVRQLQPQTRAANDSLTTLLSSEMFYHACKTPLSVLLCNLETAVEKEQGNELMEGSFQAAKKLNLLLEHVDEPKENITEVFDVAAAVQQVVIFVKARFEKATFSATVPNALLTGNKLYFQEILECLLVNAIEAQQNNTQLAPVVLIHGEVMHNEILRIDIIDFGCGMTPAETKLALLKGITYKKMGTGLGLSFAVEAMKRYFRGVLKISSAVGIGTRVTLEIPL